MRSNRIPHHLNAEQNIYLAVQALRLQLIDTTDFVSTFHRWTTNKDRTITSVLVAGGQITTQQEAELERMLESDVSAGLVLADEIASMADLRVRDALRLIKDSDIQGTLAGLAPPDGIRLDEADAPSRKPNRYEISSRYSEGALGRIWLARDQDLQRDVALKEMLPDRANDPALRRRFLNEARITSQLEHPNIVPVHELGYHEDKNRLYYTMRFVHGETLKDAIVRHHKRDRGRNALESRRLLGVVVSVCNAIAYAHSRGVLHRDLKPENVVLGAFGETVLLDWGLAKLAGSEDPPAERVALDGQEHSTLTTIGSIIGTPAYLAPEQAAAEKPSFDHRTDVYGLGAILFEILTGQPPHSGTSVAELVERIATQDSPEPRQRISTVPAALNAICGKAMAKEPSERYSSATALADDIQRFLADEPVTAYPEPMRLRATRWVRRNRGSTTAMAIVLFSIGMALVNLWWQRSSAIDHELELLGRQTRQASGRLKAMIDILRGDVTYLAALAPVESILDPADGSGKRELATAFGEFMRHHPNYFQARLIGRDGNELVRVERGPSGHVDEQITGLSSKRGRDYFDKTRTLPDGSVFLSRVELNREHGEIAEPHTPVIRAAVPVWGPDDREEYAAGVVVINVDFHELFEMLRELDPLETVDGRQVYVTNADGYFLWGTDSTTRVFAFDKREEGGADGDDRPSRLQDRFPEFSPFFASGGSSADRGIICDNTPEDSAVHIYSLRFDPSDADRFLGLVVTAPYGVLNERARPRYEFSMYTTWTLVIVLLVTFVWVAARAFHGQRDG